VNTITQVNAVGDIGYCVTHRIVCCICLPVVDLVCAGKVFGNIYDVMTTISDKIVLTT